MTEPITASAAEIAASRPPDRVRYTEWEPITRMVKRQRATRWWGGIIRTVAEWTVVEEEEIVGWKRKRMEFWDIPRRVIPVFNDSGDVGVQEIEAIVVARSEWEYDDA